MLYFRLSQRFFKVISVFSALVIFSACATSKNITHIQTVLSKVSKLKYLNTYILPYNQKFQQTIVGGLSSIDFDQQTGTWYMVSDDRSEINPARFYTAKIIVSAKGIDSVAITGVKSLLRKDGSVYPAPVGAAKSIDPEAMRYNQATKQLVWTSEGERIINSKDTVLIDPSINIMTTGGKYADTIPLPDNLRMKLTESGPIRNGVLEGLTFADNFRTLFVSLEEPLYQDGPRADLTPNKPYIRIYRFDLSTKKNTAQYAYELEPVALPSLKKAGSFNNGIPDILWLGQNRLLVTERSYSDGQKSTNIKVFVADLNGAQNIKSVQSLKKTPPAALVKKKLLLNMDDLGIYIDNIEGASFGPVLPNGHQSIVFVADNNFNPKEQMQFMIFEVIP